VQENKASQRCDKNKFVPVPVVSILVAINDSIDCYQTRGL